MTPVLGTFLILGTMMPLAAIAYTFIPTCIGTCEENATTYYQGPGDPFPQAYANMTAQQAGGHCDVPIMHGLRCLVLITPKVAVMAPGRAPEIV